MSLNEINEQQVASEEYLKKLSGDTLTAFDNIADAANTHSQTSTSASNSLANVQTFTGVNASQNLEKSTRLVQEGYQHLQREPAVARIVYEDEAGEEHLLYITRTQTVKTSGITLASMHAPVGRLAALEVGDSTMIEFPTGAQECTLIEVSLLRPTKPEGNWDSVDTIYRHESGAVKTVKSLRQLLNTIQSEDDFEAFLEAGDTDDLIAEGVAHQIRTAMGLRDQPILDKFQDDIFRLPLDSQLFIAGPPGTGKTTTLIKRLGQKLDVEYLSPVEKQLIEKTESEMPYSQNWLMFTPTELLKHYLQEAFNREQVPASDEQIKTWEKTRHYLARNVMGLLQTAATKGKFIFKDKARYLNDAVELNSTEWFEDFEQYALKQFYRTQQAGFVQLLSALAKLEDSKLNWLSELEEVLSGNEPSLTSLVTSLEQRIDDFQIAIERYNSLADKKASFEVKALFKLDSRIFSELADLLSQISQERAEQEDDDELEEEESLRAPKKLTPQEAAKQLIQVFKSVGRVRFLGRSIGKNTKNGRVLTFLKEKVPDDEVLKEIGRYSTVVSSLRLLSRLPINYLSTIPTIYKRFRREKTSYYNVKPDAQSISATELDAVILLTLKRSHQLLGISLINRNLKSSRFSLLATIASGFKAQVLVDEATDFSNLQLAAMQLLADPATHSFFACGDINQRLTHDGIKALTEFESLPLPLSVKPITTVYRQSEALNTVARELLELSGGDTSLAGELPKDYNHPGVAPVLVENLPERTDVADWLAKRIGEIESAVQVLPTIGVLVSCEDEVEPLADALKQTLEPLNIAAEACVGGKSLGEAADVRVFSTQYIKGLEFEAVFFVGIDQLAEQEVELFDKYLYVGVTRAATYLGLVANTSLPSRLLGIRDQFINSWDL